VKERIITITATFDMTEISENIWLHLKKKLKK